MKNNKVIIIAEAGVNHNGDIDIAKKLIDVASNAKADFVKFQTFNAKKLAKKNLEKAQYQSKNLNDDSLSQYQMLKKLELSKTDHKVLIEYCKKRKIKFLSTAFDIDSLHFLNSIGLEIFKVPSGEITNYPYLREISKISKKVILSTGMSNVNEISDALKLLTKNNLTKEDVTLLHCNTDYPTKYEDVNLNAMNYIESKFGIKVGYSDHTEGISIPIAATALGASIIEKHITLDRSMQGPDHKSSIEPKELNLMVKSIRDVELAISSSGIKRPTKSELKNLHVIRKGIYYSSDLKKGHIVAEKDLITMRPYMNVSPMNWTEIIGKTITKNVKKNSAFKFDHIK